MECLRKIVEFPVDPAQGIEESTSEELITQPFTQLEAFLQRGQGLFICSLAALRQPTYPEVDDHEELQIVREGRRDTLFRQLECLLVVALPIRENTKIEQVEPLNALIPGLFQV